MDLTKLLKEIQQVIAKQKELSEKICDDYLTGQGLITEISAAFDTLENQIAEAIEDCEPELNFEDVIEWLENNVINSKQDEKLLGQIGNDNIRQYYLDNLQEDNGNLIVINTGSMVERDKIKNFLETEIFTDLLRYEAAVENLPF